MFKNLLQRNLVRKFFIDGNLRDIIGRYSRSAYRYSWTAPQFAELCWKTYNLSLDLQQAIEIFSNGCNSLPICMSSVSESNLPIPDEIKSFIENPSTEQLVWADFIHSCLVQYFVGGEIFLLKDQKNKKLTLIRPDEVTKVKVVDGAPWSYTISRSFFERTKLIGYELKDYEFESKFYDGYWHNQVAHFYHRNPVFFHRGLSIVVTLLNDIEILFKGRTWNRSMLENEGRPSGVFFYPPNTTSGRRPHVPVRGHAKVEEEVKNYFSGELNAGKALFLKGGMQFKEVSYKMKDMDFLNGLYFSRESIANRLGIPLQLFGSEKKSTYNNMREARYSFYLSTCIPFYNKFLHFFTTQVVSHFFGMQKNKICINKQKIFHASPMFLDQITKLKAENFLTGNEKRELLGFKPIEEDNMDKPLLPSNMVPVEDLGMIETENDFEETEDEDK